MSNCRASTYVRVGGVIALALVLLLLAVGVTLAASNYAIDWWTIDGGGQSSTGGSYALSGTVGQHDASTAVAAGGSYSLHGGFWQPETQPETHGGIFLPLIHRTQ